MTDHYTQLDAIRATTDTLYLRADEILPGDILPDVSRSAVASVTVFPHEAVRFTFARDNFIRHAIYGGPDYGYECFRVERA